MIKYCLRNPIAGMPARVAGLAFMLLAGAACSSARTVAPPQPQPEPETYQEGLASWYGPGFDGRATASGERFSPDSLTAAHRSLPFGSRVRVINVENGRDVRVRINDRGPWIEGRIIDLSHAAAVSLGMIEAGVVQVRLIIER